VGTLAQLRTPDAVAFLRDLAGGHPQAAITVAAGRALRRVDPASPTKGATPR
jgi:hypothetical protein